MYALVMLAALVGLGQFDEELVGDGELPLVEQDVELISIAHLGHRVDLAFFWARIQGEWTCLDHRWVGTDWLLWREGGRWRVAWSDHGDGCYRTIRSDCWVESWEQESPLAEQNNRPWFAQLLEPGLKKPPSKK